MSDCTLIFGSLTRHDPGKKKQNEKGYCKATQNEFIQYKSDTYTTVEERIPIETIEDVQRNSQSDTSVDIRLKDGRVITYEARTIKRASEWILALSSAITFGSELTADSFDVLRVLGKGAYGKVYLVELKNTKERYAMKTVKKSRILDSGNIFTILSEKEILSQYKHPFIVDLKFTFQNEDKFYLVMNYATGGDLFTLMKDRAIPYIDVQLYAAQIALALQFLHDNHIIYRDLKPENLLLDSSGNICMIDFGLSVFADENGMTDGICGTAEYLAPEVVSRKEYSYAADWWSFGVVLYQLLYNEIPFYNESKMKLFESICKGELIFPALGYTDAEDFLSKLLTKNPNERANLETLKNHPFWYGIDFNAVLRREVFPSYKPAIDDDFVPNCFSSDHFISDESYINQYSQFEPDYNSYIRSLSPFGSDFVDTPAISSMPNIIDF